MNKLAQFVMEKTLNGKIDKNTGIEILKQLAENKPNRQKDIAIIGMAGRFPGSDSIDEFWDNIKNGVDCIGNFPEARKSDSDKLKAYTYLSGRKSEYCQGGYLREIDKFDYSFFKLTPKEAGFMDPNQRLFLETVFQALEDGGYGGERISGERVGIYAGYNTWPMYGQIISSIYPEAASDSVVGNLSSIIPARISFFLDLKGPAILVDTACSSSLVAVHLACRGIRNRDCDMAVAGGINIRLFPLLGEADLGTDASDFRTKTFDEGSDGTAWGEGVAALLLKPLDKAKQDGDNIYAVIKGSAVNQDGNSIGITAPNLQAQEDMLIKAWEDAGVSAETIAYVEAHGTGTNLGDPIEVGAIKMAFERFTGKKQFCAIGSVKTNIGHLDSVSGISGLIKAALALKNRVIPPSLNFNLPNHKIDFVKSPVYVNTELAEWEYDGFPRRCGVNSFGLSGTNCHVVLEEIAENSLNATGGVREENLLAISAKNECSLKELIKKYKKLAGENETASLYDICYTANTGRGHYDYRLAFALSGRDDLAEKMEALDPDNIDKFKGDGVYYSRHKIISHNKRDREAWEITEDEMYGINEEAAKTVEEYLEKGKGNPGLFDKLCRLYVKGADIDWAKLYSTGRTIRLPTYPFERKRCWAEASELNRSDRRKHMYFEIGWEERPLALEDTYAKQGSALIVMSKPGFCSEVASLLRQRGINVIEAVIGTEFKKIDEKKYIVNGSDSDYKMLFMRLGETDISQVVHMVTAKNRVTIETMDHLEEALQGGVYNLFNLLKGIYGSGIKHNMQIVVVSSYISRVTGNEEIRPENAALAGLGKVVGLESIYLKCRCIDIDDSTGAREIAEELKSDYNKYSVAYRGNKRYIEEMRKLDISKYDVHDRPLKREGVYVITGGMGGIGIEISKCLSKICAINIAFFNRTPVPLREKWDEIVKSGNDSKLSRKIVGIKEIEKRGSTVNCFCVDVSNQKQVEEALEALRNRYGKINGVIHSAGLAGNGLIMNKEEAVFRKVLLPKIYGTWILDNVTRNDKLDFFYMFSSGTSVFGDVGHGDYMAANAYLDSYEAYRNRLGGKTVTINWTGWKEVGMAKDNNANIDATFKSMLTSDAVKAFDGVFNRNICRVLIGELNFGGENLSDLSRINIPFNLSEEIISDIENYNKGETIHALVEVKPVTPDIKLKGKKDNNYTTVEIEVAKAWSEVLGFSEINVYDNFFRLGGDSIKSVQILTCLKNYRLDMKDMFEYPTIAALSEYISLSLQDSNQGLAMQNGYGGSKNHNEDYLNEFENEKILDNIQPFNDIYFKDCFYNAFFPVVKHFKKDLASFLINEVAMYNYDSTKQGVNFSINYKSARAIEEVVKESEIELKTKEESDNVIYDMLEAISDNRPVIIRLDCFYEPIRFDTCNKLHWSHSLLVFGYNIQNRMFHVMEQENMNSLTYSDKVICFDDINKAYKGYLENFHSIRGLPTYYEFARNGNCSGITANSSVSIANSYTDMYLNNIINFKSDIIKGLEYLRTFREDLGMVVSDTEALGLNIDELVLVFNEIVKAKYAEKYKYIHLKGGYSHEMPLLLDEIIESYSFIKSLLGKYKYTRRYRDSLAGTVKSKMDLIVKAEWEYHEALFNIKNLDGGKRYV